MIENTIPPRTATRRSSPLRRTLLLLLVTFVAGAAVAWYYLGRDELDFTDIASFRASESEVPAPSAVPAAPAAGTLPTTALDQRVAAMEQRLARLDLQAQAAAGNAGRAEGLLIVFASRRAIERGAPLGYLEDQLGLRFGDAQPDAVRTVVSAGRNPLTIDVLLARLEALEPELVSAPPEEGLFDRIGRELGSIFVIRRDSTPSPAADRRLSRARLFLESGRPGAAAAEVRMLPNASVAADWLREAERFAETQRALDLLETTAILDPRALRDSAGEPILQRSPAEPAAQVPPQG